MTLQNRSQTHSQVSHHNGSIDLHYNFDAAVDAAARSVHSFRMSSELNVAFVDFQEEMV